MNWAGEPEVELEPDSELVRNYLIAPKQEPDPVLFYNGSQALVLIKVNESETQCDENHSNTGCNRPANHLSSS